MCDTFTLESPYLSLEEAAKFVKRSDRTFRRYVKQYKIPTYGPGRCLFMREDLQAFMEDAGAFLGAKRRPAPRRAYGFTPVSIQ